MVTWDSEVVHEDSLPKNLSWHEYQPNTDYTCKLLFAQHFSGFGYRQVKFPDGSAIFSRLTYKTVAA